MDNGHARSRLVAMAVITALIAGSAGAASAATHRKVLRHTRTVKLAYTAGCTLEVMVTGIGGAISPGACSVVGAANYSLTAKRGEKYVTVKVADATGQAVPGQFWIKGTQLAQDTEVPFCGAHRDVPVTSAHMLLDLDAVGADSACPGVATTGTITLVFSNLP